MNIPSIDDGHDVSRPEQLWVYTEYLGHQDIEKYLRQRILHDKPRIWKLHDRVWVADWISTYFLAQDEIPKFRSEQSMFIINLRSVLSASSLEVHRDRLVSSMESKFNCHIKMLDDTEMGYFVISFDDIQDSLMFKLTGLTELREEYPMVGYFDVTEEVTIGIPERSVPTKGMFT